MRIGEPTANRHCVLRVEDVAGGRVVDDDRLLEIPADLAEVFDVVALVIVAGLAEESVMYNMVDIELVQEWVAVLCNRCGEHNNFVELADAL